MRRDDRTWERQYMPFVLAIVATAVGSFGTYDFFALLTFLAVLAIYVVRDYDCRILLGLGLVLLALGMTQRILEQDANAIKAGNQAFYFLAAGTVGEAVRYLRVPERMSAVQAWWKRLRRQRTRAPKGQK